MSRCKKPLLYIPPAQVAIRRSDWLARGEAKQKGAQLSSLFQKKELNSAPFFPDRRAPANQIVGLLPAPGIYIPEVLQRDISLNLELRPLTSLSPCLAEEKEEKNQHTVLFRTIRTTTITSVTHAD